MPDLVARGALMEPLNNRVGVIARPVRPRQSRVQRGDARTVAAEVLPLMTMIDVRLALDDTSAHNAFSAATGITLSQKAGGPAPVARAPGSNGRYALWLGPDEWLMIGAADDTALADLLAGALAGRRASVVDVSDLRTVFRLTGPLARDLLAKGCAVDLHPRVLAPGMSVVTQFARVRALVHLHDAPPAFDLYFERTVAQYAWRWLADAMLEFTA